MTTADDFALHRTHLIGVAYRLTGSVELHVFSDAPGVFGDANLRIQISFDEKQREEPGYDQPGKEQHAARTGRHQLPTQAIQPVESHEVHSRVP